MLLTLAVSNLFRNRFRSFLTMSAISFGCASLIISGGFMQDSITQTKENYIRAFIGHLRVVKSGFFAKGLLNPYSYMIADSETVIPRIAQVPGVSAVAPRIEFPGLLSTGDNTLPFHAQAIVPDIEERVSQNFRMLSGENLKAGDFYHVVLGRGMAEAIGVKTGDQVTLLVTTARGSMNAMDMTIKGIFQTLSKAFDDHAIRVSLPAGQKLMRTQNVQTMTVFLDRTDDADTIAETLRETFKQESMDFEVRPWHALPEADFVVKLVPFYGALFGVLRFIIIMMVFFGIFNTINTAVLERVGEIGTLGALGTRRRDILKLFLLEGTLLGMIGSVCGIVMGLVLGTLISWVGLPMPVAPGTTMNWIARIEITPLACISAGVLVVLAASFSTLLPAFKASRLDIAEALRHNI